ESAAELDFRPPALGGGCPHATTDGLPRTSSGSLAHAIVPADSLRGGDRTAPRTAERRPVRSRRTRGRIRTVVEKPGRAAIEPRRHEDDEFSGHARAAADADRSGRDAASRGRRITAKG